MSAKLLIGVAAIAVAIATLVVTASAGEAKKGRHVWTPPVDVTQALKITMETPATEDLLKKAAEQCFDAECKKQVEQCRKHLSTCVIVPSKASVHEQENENN